MTVAASNVHDVRAKIKAVDRSEPENCAASITYASHVGPI